VADRHGLLLYQAALDNHLKMEISDLRRKTLFLGLSDGARIDTLRHSSVGVLSNEQLVATTTPDREKWLHLVGDLQRDLCDPRAKFAVAYLIDDFVASGTSFLRSEGGKWKGKLDRFRESISQVKDEVFDDDFLLCVHHYIGTDAVASKLDDRRQQYEQEIGHVGWGKVQFSFGMTLPAELPLSRERQEDQPFIALADRYYDPQIETRHTRVGGEEHLHLGYAGCALPVVLEHNTPNNSVALLWAETQGSATTPAPAMRPLFRRRQRHT
jgi:hypothetical protein